MPKYPPLTALLSVPPLEMRGDERPLLRAKAAHELPELAILLCGRATRITGHKGCHGGRGRTRCRKPTRRTSLLQDRRWDSLTGTGRCAPEGGGRCAWVAMAVRASQARAWPPRGALSSAPPFRLVWLPPFRLLLLRSIDGGIQFFLGGRHGRGPPTLTELPGTAAGSACTRPCVHMLNAERCYPSVAAQPGHGKRLGPA